MSKNEQWVIDLDGVIWVGKDPIPGGGHAIEHLRAWGRRVAFFTNNSFPTNKELLEKLVSCGIICEPGEVLSSAQAAATLCHSGERAICIGGPGIVEALELTGVSVTKAEDHKRGDPVDVVVVGFDPHFEFERFANATRAIGAGARLVGTNDDATYPMPDGPVPGGGSILHAVAYAAGVTPTVAGKPNDAAVSLIEERIGHIDVAVGDRPSTDGALAARLNAKFALVHSGVKEPLSKAPTAKVVFEAADLDALVHDIVGH